ncbi:carcinine transporter-like [Centruroides sculpturatus]|uniref:carcinine transporter-like n=1 Tax=Centruroides sculpturatus TaxID=218467 RepID=UPI000C6E4F46|nr:carcinine transporter-like [Centruroides sculpturatus]
MDFDDVLPHIGGYGRYQIFFFSFIVIPSNILSGFGYINFLFVSGIPDHWCFVPELQFLSLELQKNLSIPTEEVDGTRRYSKCLMFDVNYTQILQYYNNSRRNWPKVKCRHGWNYERSVYDTTLISEMNIVCDRSWMSTLANSAYYIGGIIGSLWFGYMGDKWGRKPAYITAVVFYLGASVLSCFPTNYAAYILYRGLVGVTFPASFQIPLVIVMEIMSPDKRTRDGMLSNIYFSVGLALTAGIAYILRKWFTIALATSLPLLFLCITFFFVAESPRWLISKNRYEEAENVVQKIAKYNGTKIEKNFLKMHLFSGKDERKEIKEANHSYLDLFRYPTMRKNFIILTIDCIIISLAYPVLSFGVSLLNINEYLASATSSLVEIPGIIFSWIIMEKIGRMWSMVVTMSLGGLSCLCVSLFSLDYVWTINILTNLGKFFISGAWAIVYIYGCELFPTDLRNSAISATSLLANAASIASPYVLMLKNVDQMLPFVLVGVISLISALLTLLLPETKDKHLPQTIAESEMLRF